MGIKKEEILYFCRLGIVIGLIALFGLTALATITAAFINAMELRWGWLVFCLVVFSISVGCGYVLVSCYNYLIEQKNRREGNYMVEG